MKEINTPTQQIGISVWRKRRLVAYATLLLANILLFSYTSPLESSTVFVIGGFLLISTDLVIVTHFFVRFLCLLAPKLDRFRRRLTVALAAFGIAAAALASLGQLTWRDVVVVVIIGLIGYMYSLRFRLGMK